LDTHFRWDKKKFVKKYLESKEFDKEMFDYVDYLNKYSMMFWLSKRSMRNMECASGDNIEPFSQSFR
jgi:hypothetical protein